MGAEQHCSSALGIETQSERKRELQRIPKRTGTEAGRPQTDSARLVIALIKFIQIAGKKKKKKRTNLSRLGQHFKCGLFGLMPSAMQSI